MSRYLQTSTGMKMLDTTVTPEVDYYTRPADWLDMPNLAEGDEQITMLIAVYDHNSNFVAFDITGDYTVDWGDGSTPENYTSGAQAERNLQYEDFVGTDCARGYRQALVTITPQTSGGLLTARLAEQNSQAASTYTSQTLDVVVAAQNMTSITMYGASQSTMLEVFNFVGSNEITSGSSMFYQCFSLQYIKEFDTSKITTALNMFRECRSLRIAPSLDFSLVQYMSHTYRDCLSLQRVPSLGTSSALLSMITTFQDCHSLQSIDECDVSGVTNFDGTLTRAYSLAKIDMNGVSSSISCGGGKMSAAELNSLFERLATVSSGTVTISLNWGADTCDQTIATAKGWTVTN